MPSIVIDPSVFNPVYVPSLDDMARTQIFFGGSSSGKSVFVAQRAVIDIMKGGRNYLICRQVGRTIRSSVFMEISKVIKEWNLDALFNINKTDGLTTCANGYQIVFIGLDDVEKVKSITPAKGVFTDIWVEEATETDFRTVKQLHKRQRGGDANIPKRLMLTFNPILKSHWIYETYFSTIGWAEDQTKYSSPSLSILKTTYKDNTFLTPQDVADLESESDRYFYEVYTLGKWGILGNVIFRNWEVQDLSKMRAQFVYHRHGGDFGYSDDPCGVVCTHYDRPHKTIYIYDELYLPGLTNNKLATEVIRLIGSDPIVFDSAEPKSIAELKGYGVVARGARKGKDSVRFGIQWLQQQHIVVDSKCINSQMELTQFKWKEDSLGHALPEPVETHDHLISALRYAYENESLDKFGKRARSWSGVGSVTLPSSRSKSRSWAG